MSDADPRLGDVAEQVRRHHPELTIDVVTRADLADQEQGDWIARTPDCVGSLVLPSTGPGHYALDVYFDALTPYPGHVDVAPNHAVTIRQHTHHTRPHLFVCVGDRHGPPTPAADHDLEYARLRRPRFQLLFLHVNDMPGDGEPLGAFWALDDAVDEVRRLEAATTAAVGFPQLTKPPDHLVPAATPLHRSVPAGREEPLGR